MSRWRSLGPTRLVAFGETAYIKIHLPERNTWVICRLFLGSKRRAAWVPLPLENVQGIAPGFALSRPQAGWTCINVTSSAEIEQLGDVMRAAWDSQRQVHPQAQSDDGEDDEPSTVDLADNVSPEGEE